MWCFLMLYTILNNIYLFVLLILQIENEYGNVMGPYGESGKEYIKWCANMAQSLDVGVPWIMCQQNDAPQPMVIRSV